MIRAFAALLALTYALALPASAAQQWLVVSDIHFDPYLAGASPSGYGNDSNAALLDATLAEMLRADPHPPVVVIAGDFLAHHFAQLAAHHHEDAQTAAVRAMRAIAHRFGSAFPQARFIVTLGNNDDYCGDYRSEDGGSYQRALERIWLPLVQRGGAHTSFARTFLHGGFYSDDVLDGRLRILVVNDIPWSFFAGGPCQPARGDPAATERAWLAREVRRERSIAIVSHIPPGIDASTTALLRGFVNVPFLNANAQAAFVRDMQAPGVRWALFGHTHRFELRSIGNTPALVVSSISPVYDNNPAFYVVAVGPNGSLDDVRTEYFDETAQRWRSAGSLDRAFGIARLDGRALAGVRRRIARDPSLRARWQARAVSWSTRVKQRYWRYAWCAQRVPSNDYAGCAHTLMRRGLALSAAVAIALGALTTIVLFVRRRRRRRRV